MSSFTERGGWWVVIQFGLFGLYGLAIVATGPVAEGIGLGFARIVGTVLVAVGAVAGIWAILLHRGTVSVFPAPSEGSPLVAQGPYRFVRHPIYFAVISGTLGLSLALLRPGAVLVALALVPFFMAKSEHEERMLMEHYPTYRDYRSEVRHRLIPWLL